MPLFGNDDTMESQGTGTYAFSATRIDRLTATEYTLAAIAVDRSGSVGGFEGALNDCLGEILKACRRSPRADNLMLRTLTFDEEIEETHGFKPLGEISLDAYQGAVVPRGMTALYDATINALDSVLAYGKTLVESDFAANGIVFVLTDGLDNRSMATPATVKRKLDEARRGEKLESVLTILVGVNVVDPSAKIALETFAKEAGFTQFVDVGAATDKTLAKLAQFVSKSVSAQSQALGSGGASKPLAF